MKGITNASLLEIVKSERFAPPTTQNHIYLPRRETFQLLKVYKGSFDTAREVKLAMFQFNIIHNILYTKERIAKAKLSRTNTCYLCKCSAHTATYACVLYPHPMFLEIFSLLVALNTTDV